jgi:type 1 glutamine amidotransferase
MLKRLMSVLLLVACALPLTAGEGKTKILLIGKDRDHAFSHHEYLPDCQILAKCLRQTPGIEAVVSNGWPKDPAMLKGVKAIVLHTRMGGNVLFGDPKVRAQAEELLNNGVGLTAIHWSTGAEKDVGQLWLDTLGGWFHGDQFSKYLVRTTKLKQTDPSHPICNGWKEYDLREEYYIKLKFRPEIKTVMAAEIDKVEYPVGWVYERPNAKGGRSFGFVGGHFHSNFGEPEFRRAIVNGILWTAHVEVPPQGAPVAITAADMELPPDDRKAPAKKGKSETIKLFNGKDLDGWEGYEDLWSVKDGVIVAKNTEPIKYSTYLLTKRNFRDFRLIFSAKLVESEMHSGVALWGRKFPMVPGVKDPKAARTEYTYQGHLVMFPSGWGMFDLYRRMGLKVDGGPAKKVGKQHDWNDMEILALGNRIRLAVNGHAVVNYLEKQPQTIQAGPIGLQLHSNNVPQEVHFKGLVLTTNPEDKLITVK